MILDKIKGFLNIPRTQESVKEEKGYNPTLIAKIQPQGGIKFNDSYVRLGDGYLSCVHVYKYQNVVQNFWLEPIVNMPNVIATLDIANANKKEIVEKLNKAMAEQSSRFATAKDNVDRIDAKSIYAELESLYEELKVGELLKYVHLRLYVKGRTLEEVETNTMKVLEELESMNFRGAIFLNEQEWEFDSLITNYQTQLKYPNKRKGKAIPVSTLAASNPFHYTSISDRTGSFLGTTYTGGSVVFDLFHKDSQRKHFNALMVGAMGSGKSTLLKKQVLEQAIRGNKVRILDVTGEFGDLVNQLGGKQIALDGTQGIINPLHVYKTSVNDDGTTNEELSFMQHLSKLKVFYTYLKPNASDDEKTFFSTLLRKLYINKNLWSENREVKIAITEFSSHEYPTFSEFLTLIQSELYTDFSSKNLKENLSQNTIDLLTSIELAVKEIVDTYGNIFDGISTLQSFDSEKVVSFPLRSILSMNSQVFQAQLFNIMNTLWDGMIVNGSHQFKKFNKGELNVDDAVKYLIVIDEAHQIINTKAESKHAVQYIERFMREARKYFGGIFFVSHSINDFVPNGTNNENAENIKKLFQLTQYKFIAQQDSITIPVIKNIFEGQITDSELQSIPRFETGHVVLSISGVKNITFKVEIPQNEMNLFGGGA